MIQSESGEALRRLRTSLSEAEAELAGSDPQAPLRAMAALEPAEQVLRWAMYMLGEGTPPVWPPGEWHEAEKRIGRLRRRFEFGAVYWSGMVGCCLAAEAYGPEIGARASGQEVGCE